MKKYFCLVLFSLFLFAFDAPYSLKKFDAVLDVSKLQAPRSEYNPLYSRKYGDFKWYANRFFYLRDNKYMVFYMCGNHNRSELRFKNIWKTDTKSEKYIEAEVKLFPLNEKREFTFLQIHADNTLKNTPVIDKPLLRIVWREQYKNVRNHIWAVLRTDGGKYKKTDLGVMPKGFFDVKISVLNNTLSICINKEKKFQTGVAYWKKYYNYFKAGVYLQDGGCAEVLFNRLQISQ